MKQIYFDNAATTSVDERVYEAMKPYFCEIFGNSHAIHSLGQAALSAVEQSRETVADFFGAKNQEIIFTSGASESNNLAIQGVANYFFEQNKKIHIITSKIEHPSVLEVFKALAKRGVEVSFVDVDKDGVVDLSKLQKAIKANTALISIMYANNEVGSIQPIAEIGKLVSREREKREAKGLPIYFHCDAVQAVNYLSCNVDELGVDLLSVSGHKFYGPKGIGVLYLRKGVKISPVQFGGHQEFNLRPGTLSVPLIVGLAKALQLIKDEKQKNIKKVVKIKEKIYHELEKFSLVKFNGDQERQIPSIINVSFKNAEGESILMMLDMEGVAISTGSACSSGSLEPSHVLTAMGNPPEWSHGSIRISLSKNNSEVEVGVFIKALQIIIKKLRDMAP
jgi:cysteine desulfurase